MNTTMTVKLIGWTVRGLDRRTDSPFEDFIVLDTRPDDQRLSGMKKRIGDQYGLLGYDVNALVKEREQEIVLDLVELFDNGKLPKPLSPETEAAIEALFDETKEPGVSDIDQDLPAPPAEEAQDETESNEGPDAEPGQAPDTAAGTEGFGEIDKAKFRQKVQAALLNYVKKHGEDNLRPIVRSTGNRVTEKTLQKMLKDISGFENKHWMAVDKALRKLEVEDIAKETADV